MNVKIIKTSNGDLEVEVPLSVLLSQTQTIRLAEAMDEIDSPTWMRSPKRDKYNDKF